MSWYRGLLQLASSFNPPSLLDYAASDSIDAFVEIHGYANVIGDNPNAIADIEPMAGFAKVDEAVLLIHLGKHGLGRFHYVAKADLATRSRAIRRKGLGSPVHDHLSGFRRGYDGDHNRGRAFVERAGPGERRIPVVEDIRARPDFVQARQQVGMEQGRRRSSADYAWIEPGMP
jgi:hypothetical protein